MIGLILHMNDKRYFNTWLKPETKRSTTKTELLLRIRSRRAFHKYLPIDNICSFFVVDLARSRNTAIY